MSMLPANVAFIKDYVRQQSAVDLSDRDYLITTRLQMLAADIGMHDADAVVEAVRLAPNDDLAEAVVDSLMTHETRFFRDHHPFEALRNSVLPRLIEARSTVRHLRIWSAGCASGQEPYSIAMLLDDAFPELADWEVEILATDLCKPMVERTADGRYSPFEVNRGLPVTFLLRFFDEEHGLWQVNDSLRSRVQPLQLNLVQPWPEIGEFDLVLLRNVLIYFEPEARQQVLESVAKHLTPDGALLLGSSESLNGLDAPFNAEKMDRGEYYRLAAGH
jgi:chemotaxis protein methyltransferase CheR